MRPTLFVLAALLTLAGTSRVLAAPLPAGTYPINGIENPPTSFSSLTTAAAYLGANGVTGTGEVLLELRSGYFVEPGPVTIAPIPGTGPGLGVRIRPKSGFTATTNVNCAVGQDWAIRIMASYVSLDGVLSGGVSHWTIRASPTDVTRPGRTAVRIDGSAGVTNVSVASCYLEGVTSDGVAATVYVTGGAAAVSNISLSGNWIRGSLRDVAVACEGVTHPGSTGLSISGNDITSFRRCGVRITGTFPDAVVKENTIYVTGSPPGVEGTTLNGIEIWSPAAGITLENNFIHDLTMDGPAAVSGIFVNTGSATGNPLRIRTNRISLYRGSASGQRFEGIRLGLGMPAGAPVEVDYNTVVLAGSHTSSTGTAAFRVENAIALRLRNNIFLNARNNTTGTAPHWAIAMGSPAALAEIGHNDYRVSGSGGVLGTTDGSTAGNRPTLALWQAGVPADSTSLDVNPPLINYTTNPPALGLDTSHLTRLESGGVVIPGIDFDYQRERRFGAPLYTGQGAAPDIGADEVDMSPWWARDVSATALVSPPNGSYVTVGAPLTLQGSLLNEGYLDLPGVPLRLLISGPLPSTATVYDQVVVSGPVASLASASVTFPGGTLSAPGTYQVTLATELAGDEYPDNDTFSGSLTAVSLLSGSYDVGAGLAPPFNSLTSALAHLVAIGAGGPVTFRLVNDFYNTASGETFPIFVDHYPGESATNRLTIRPSPAARPTISTTSTSALILRGVDYFTLDGSSGSGSLRFLRLTTTGTASGGAVLWARPTTGSDGVSHAVLQNLIVGGSGTGKPLIGIGFGGVSPALTSDGSGHDGNVIRNCLVQGAEIGIYLAGSVTDRNEGNLVEQCELGGEISSEYLYRCGLLLRYEDAPIVRNNRIYGLHGSSVTTAGATLGIALGLGPSPDPFTQPPAAPVRNALVAGNRLSDLRATGTNGWSTVGILVGGADAGLTRIVNNMVSDIDENNVSSGTSLLAGVLVTPGAAPVELLHNSIALHGARVSPANTPAIGIAILAGDPPVTLRNNIVRNTMVPWAGGRAYAVGHGGATRAAFVADHNLYQVAGTSANPLGVVGLGFLPAGATANLAAWQAATGQDAGSLAGDARFVDVMADLHIDTSPGPTSPAANAGAPLATVPTDFDGAARGAVPDLGADEFTTHALSLAILGAGSVQRSPDYATYNPGTTVTLTAAPAARFLGWSGDVTGNANPAPVVMSAPRAVAAHFVEPPTLSVADGGLLEGNAGSAPLPFVLRLSTTWTDTVRVTAETADGTALVADGDYQPLAPLTVTFPPGDTAAVVAIPIFGDATPEPDETFALRLSVPVNATLGDSVATGTIEDDDANSGVGEETVTRSILGTPRVLAAGGRIEIPYALAVPGEVRLLVLDATGRRVTRLDEGPQPAGRHRALWDGRTEAGRRLAAGVYWLRLVAPDAVAVARLIVTR